MFVLEIFGNVCSFVALTFDNFFLIFFFLIPREDSILVGFYCAPYQRLVVVVNFLNIFLLEEKTKKFREKFVFILRENNFSVFSMKNVKGR